MLLGFLPESYPPSVKHIPPEANGFVARAGNTTGQSALLEDSLFCSFDIVVDGCAPTGSIATGIGQDGLCKG